LEQRFGRIHRIGQTEVCHLWNLVAGQTREGQVYQRLLSKLETESNALEGKVFDVLGLLFEQTPLRKLLIDAIRYNDQPEVRARLEQTVDHAVDKERVRDLLERRSLVTETMDTSQIMRVREEMERYAARRLQPHYIKSFFMQAFEGLGGAIREREPGRYRISYVPARIRHRARELGTTVPVWEKYDRVCFDKELVQQPGQPQADFICPGHPLLDTVIDLVLEQQADLLRAGAVLVDETDPDQEARVLFFLEQNIQDAGVAHSGERRIISREVHFVEIDRAGNIRAGGYAPYLDYRPATAAEIKQIGPLLSQESPPPPPSPAGGGSLGSSPQRGEAGRGADWLDGETLESRVTGYAIEQLVPHHLKRIKARREALIDKTLAAVHERLTKEINYWDKRAAELRQQEKQGKVNVRLNAELAQRRADELMARLERRKEELAQERQISATPPVVIGGALVVPLGLLLGEQTPPDLAERRITEAIAMKAVMQAETSLGNHPKDVSKGNLGYDLESLEPRTGHLRFIEVKGRKAEAETVTVTHNEIMCGINSPEQFILALVEVENGQGRQPRYVRNPFPREPHSTEASINYRLADFLERSEPPG
jgi:hypothetical protein